MLWPAQQNLTPLCELVLKKSEETALHVAARYGHAQVVDFLCSSGANINILDSVSIEPFVSVVSDFCLTLSLQNYSLCCWPSQCSSGVLYCQDIDCRSLLVEHCWCLPQLAGCWSPSPEMFFAGNRFAVVFTLLFVIACFNSCSNQSFQLLFGLGHYFCLSSEWGHHFHHCTGMCLIVCLYVCLCCQTLVVITTALFTKT